MSITFSSASRLFAEADHCFPAKGLCHDRIDLTGDVALPMMQRIPEPELMDDFHQVEAYANADFSGTDDAFVERLGQLCVQYHCPFAADQVLLDLGCGPGNISHRLSKVWPACHVIGIDAASTMLAVARERQARDLGAVRHLHFRQLSLRDLADQGPSAFANHQQPRLLASGVISNSLLHHLHDPQQLWLTTAKLAAPGALVLHRDLRRPSSAAAALALRERHLAHAPEVLRHDYLASLHAAFTPEEVQAQLNTAGLQTLDVIEVGDRYLDVIGRLP